MSMRGITHAVDVLAAIKAERDDLQKLLTPPALEGAAAASQKQDRDIARALDEGMKFLTHRLEQVLVKPDPAPAPAPAPAASA